MGFFAFILAAVLGFYIYKLKNEQNKLKENIHRIQLKIIALEGELLKYLRRSDEDFTPHKKPAPMAEKPETIGKEPSIQKTEEITPEPGHKSEPPKSKKATMENFEESLSTRWLVWVGGLAFALGGGFLVKYSIDAGLLSPLVRVSLGFVTGIVMTLGGEVLRQRRTHLEWLNGTPDYLPGAISAAGLFSAFAAIYASYALYDLLPALMAFIALALLSFVSSGLAYYQGKFFAYLGLIGGMIVPALVSTDSPNAWYLFPYLLTIVASSLWVSRQKAWIDVAATTLVLALLWVIIWIPTNWALGDIIPVGLYLLLVSGLNAALLSGASPERVTDKTFKGMVAGNGITRISDIATLIAVILIVTLVRIDHYSATGFILIGVGLMAQAYCPSSPQASPIIRVNSSLIWA